MAVTEEIKKKAINIEVFNNWRYRLSRMKPIDYAYGGNHEPRRYYTDGGGRYYYRVVTEYEMHRNK